MFQGVEQPGSWSHKPQYQDGVYVRCQDEQGKSLCVIRESARSDQLYIASTDMMAFSNDRGADSTPHSESTMSEDRCSGLNR